MKLVAMFPHKGDFPPMGGSSNIAPSNLPIDGQWMSQSAYQNIDLDTVDWAVLAQQWIHMKETCPAPAEPMVNAPPPPRFTSADYEEQGEAPMEVDDDQPNVMNAPPPPTNIFQTNNWNSESGQHGHHQKKWNRKGNRWNQNHPKAHRSANNHAAGQVFNNAKTAGAWPGGSSAPPFLPAGDVKAHGSDAKSGIQLEQIGLNATPPLDAAQRKTLPAWIRQGLEKMEREKVKQAERDREMKERDEKRRQERLVEQNLLMQLSANDASPKLPAKSKFESDSDSDNDDTVNSDYSEKMAKAERTTVCSENTSSPAATTPPVKPHRTKAEMLTEIMLSVRKNLTEILLEVTNEEIHAIAQDTFSKTRSKGRKPQTVQKNALTAIAPALGLVVYDDSDASRSGDDNDSDYDRPNDHIASDFDSESELKKTIYRRKIAFESKSNEIESYLAEIEEREKQWLERDDTESAEEPKVAQDPILAAPLFCIQPKSTETNEIRDPPKLQSVSKSERKGSRFSDAKGLVYNVGSSQLTNITVPIPSTRPLVPEYKPMSSDSKKHDTVKKDSESDDSQASRKKSKHSSSSKSSRHRSKRDRSRSPPSRRHKKSSRRRSSSSSSDRSSYSRHSDRSRKHSRRERSSSDDRTSKSSQGSHKRDKHSRETSYSSSRSYKRSRH